MKSTTLKSTTSWLALASVTLLGTACLQTAPTVGSDSARTAATGSAGGANATNVNSKLERCDQSLGTLSVVEDQRAPWFAQLSQYQLQSTVPVLRMLVQQSNCFVVVERGRAMGNVMQERALQQSGELRGNSNMGPGQMAAADYTMSPTITFSQKGTSGLGGFLAGRVGGGLGAIAGGLKFNEASTMLLLIDNRSGVQLAAAEGASKNTDFNLGILGVGSGGAGGLGGYSNSPEGKLIIAAFMDSYNQMVQSVRNYRAQEVRGGLGTGGALGVQGGTTPASQPQNVAPAAAPSRAPAPAAGPARSNPPAAAPATGTQRRPATRQPAQ
jgi:curli biogenesis system outer membrane secretion channel CsgG